MVGTGAGLAGTVPSTYRAPVLAPARRPWELRVSGRVPLLVQAPTRLEQKSFSKFSTESTSKDPALESVMLRNNWRWADCRVF